MTGPDIDLNAAARIDEAIAATGATTVDFEVQTRPAQGMAEAMNSLMGGPDPVQFVFTVEPDGLDVGSPERADAPAGPSDDVRDEAEVIGDVLSLMYGQNPQAAIENLESERLVEKLLAKFDAHTVADAVEAAGWDVDEHGPSEQHLKAEDLDLD